MKIVFFALFLLFAFSTKLPSATADFVQDVEGNLIENGGSYYILPVIRGHGGGLGLTQVGNETCPLTVAQARSEISSGSPVRIASPYLISHIYEVPGWFKIEKYLDDYKLVFCSKYSVTCSDLRIYNDDQGEKRLIVTNDKPFNVMFKKVDTSAI
ncbi:hypothetical protein L6164_033248 [Bauhinia variegata]|uniref:Uncharacterized protein n=1 Tax=Bauhinia variegata TaxID=167791 RepID=A0ACB9KRI8_BAUVA|nr:hypothetical protein L6164_033248 [Bauhinia variegata]